MILCAPRPKHKISGLDWVSMQGLLGFEQGVHDHDLYTLYYLWYMWSCRTSIINSSSPSLRFYTSAKNWEAKTSENLDRKGSLYKASAAEDSGQLLNPSTSHAPHQANSTQISRTEVGGWPSGATAPEVSRGGSAPDLGVRKQEILFQRSLMSHGHYQRCGGSWP